jgi:hypothetical protein
LEKKRAGFVFAVALEVDPSPCLKRQTVNEVSHKVPPPPLFKAEMLPMKWAYKNRPENAAFPSISRLPKKPPQPTPINNFGNQNTHHKKHNKTAQTTTSQHTFGLISNQYRPPLLGFSASLYRFLHTQANRRQICPHRPSRPSIGSCNEFLIGPKYVRALSTLYRSVHRTTNRLQIDAR